MADPTSAAITEPPAEPSGYSLVPWMRRGLASLATAATTTNYATLQVAVDVNGTSVPAPPIRLLGPGEVTSIDAAAIVRTDPRDGADAFEPNYLAMVELALPDLPWLFSSAAPNGARLRPWICLLVVLDGAGRRAQRHAGRPRGPAPDRAVRSDQGAA